MVSVSNMNVNDLAQQFDGELQNIRSSVGKKIKDIEAKLNQVDGFATRMDSMFKMIETNDDNIKLRFQQIEQKVSTASQTNLGTTAMMSAEMMKIRNEITTEYNAEIKKVCVGVQNTFNKLELLAKTIQSDNQNVANRMTLIENHVVTFKDEVVKEINNVKVQIAKMPKQS